MKFYKMYLMDENKTFASYYQQFFCDMRMKLGVHYNITETKQDWALKSDDPEDYDVGYFGLRSPEIVLWYFRSEFPSGYLNSDAEGIDTDVMEMYDFAMVCSLFAKFGMPVICECEGIPKDPNEDWWNNWNSEHGYGCEFIDQTIIRVVHKISLQEVEDMISRQYEEVK